MEILLHRVTFFFQEYMLFRAEADEKSIMYKKMQSLVDTPSMISITRDSWRHLQTLWQRMELLVGFSAGSHE